MNRRRIITILAALLLTITPPVGATPSYRSVFNSAFGFTIRVPASWKVMEYDLGYRYVIVCSKDHDTEIVIAASEHTVNTDDKWANWEEWYRVGKGFMIRSIVETKTMDLGNNMVTKMLLFEHQEKGVQILERVLITKSEKSVITIECRAPVWSYGSFSDTFTTVMGSLYRLDTKKK